MFQMVRTMLKGLSSAPKIISIIQMRELSSETLRHFPKATEPGLCSSMLLLYDTHAWTPLYARIEQRAS